MGHLGRLKQEYRDLAKRLEKGTVRFPEPEDEAARAGWRDILEILYTPEEAALAAKLPVRPVSLEKLAARLGEAPATLAAKLEPMCDRGVVMDLVHPRSGKTSYLLSPPIVGFVEYSLMRAKDSIPKKRMAEALHAYMNEDSTFAREAFSSETVIGRSLVHETAIADEPLPDVLAWQRASEVIGSAHAWAVSLCFCRHKAEHLGEACGAPMEICLSLNGGAQFVTRRKFGRAIERAEALDILAAAREQGLVQIADNVRNRPTWICNCCGCCCEQLQGVSKFGLRAVNPSGFLPRCEDQRCAGCSRCARACPVGAIAMEARQPSAAAQPSATAQPVAAAGRSPTARSLHPQRAERPGRPRANALGPRVDEDRCIGCGVCADACNKDALRMERVGPPPTVPANSVEKAVRMALERNNLADLLIDQGAGLGSRFLHRAVDAIVRLPPAQAVLAKEQVRSRFVDAALRRFRGMV